MQTNKFHSRKNIRRNLTQVNTATTHRRFNLSDDVEPESHGVQQGGSGSYDVQDYFPEFQRGAAGQDMGEGSGQHDGRDVTREEMLKKGVEELSYYMGAKTTENTSKSKPSRNYRSRRSSSVESRGSEDKLSSKWKERLGERPGHKTGPDRRDKRDTQRSRSPRSHRSRSPRRDSRNRGSGSNDRNRHGERDCDRRDRDINDRNSNRHSRNRDRPDHELRDRELRDDRHRRFERENISRSGDRDSFNNRGELIADYDMDDQSLREEFSNYGADRNQIIRDDRQSFSQDFSNNGDRYLDDGTDQRNVRYSDDYRDNDSDRFSQTNRIDDRDQYSQLERFDERDRFSQSDRIVERDGFGPSDRMVDHVDNFHRDADGYSRSHSPAFRDDQNRRYKRELSPISDGRSVGELTIHVSNRGRWIETERSERDLSPVSDDFDHRDTQGYGRVISNDHVTVENISDEEGAYISDAEMVSDEETYSEQNFDNLRNWDQGRYNDMERSNPRYREDFERQSRDDYERRSKSGSDRHESIKENRSHNDHRHRDNENRSRKLTYKIPNICRYHANKEKVCTRAACFQLHICKSYVLENCTLGDRCPKGHDFFFGQPYEILKKLNPDIKPSFEVHQKLILMLQRRILIAVGRSELLPVLDEKEKELERFLSEVDNGDHQEPERIDTRSRGYSESCESRASCRHEHSERRVDNVSRNDRGRDIHRSRSSPEFDNDNNRRASRSEYSEPSDTSRNDRAIEERQRAEEERHQKERKRADEERKREERKRVHEERKREKANKQLDKKIKRDLSPVSGDERDWEECETYEKVSDDGMVGNEKVKVETRPMITESVMPVAQNMPVEKKAQLDAVSPSRSDDGLNKPLDFPLPKPDHIAVPIGQNDPLVFNRPLGNNPKNYIGPMNVPPPSILPNPSSTPLFPIQSQPPIIQGQPPIIQGQPPILQGQPPIIQGQPPILQGQPPILQGQPPIIQGQPPMMNMPQFNPNLPPPISLPVQVPPPMAMGGMVPAFIPGAAAAPLFPQPVPAPVPIQNHLPSTDFMKHVIQNLPTVKNTFKNDNTPLIVDNTPGPSKKTEDKVEKDPELKEHVKTLWKFPHKSVVNMSIIDFVTETEAYKDEFVAEVVKLLITLQLPYVTMKKLMAVIKDKMMINIKSPTDMRKILDMYSGNFKIIETVDSDDDDDEETTKTVQIKANVTLGFCEKHGILPFKIGKCDCNALHICKFFVFSNCTNRMCKFGHKLKTDHNITVLKNHRLHRLTGEELIDFISDIDNRNRWTTPGLCRYYTREKGCYKGDNTSYDTICHSLHICYYALKGICTNKDCDRHHDIRGTQPLSLLQKFGLDPNEYGDDRIRQLIVDIITEVEKTSKAPLVKKAAQKASPTEEQTGVEQTGAKLKPKATMKRQTVKVPSICKFYQNELGCRKKDWGPEGRCLFVHICQYFVNGECKFGDKCKRSHDLYSGQAAELLKEYNIHTECLSVSEILGLLNKTGTMVEIPVYEEPSPVKSTEDTPVKEDNESKENDKTVERQKPIGSAAVYYPTSVASSSAQLTYTGRNSIEDMIQHIINEKRVNKEEPK